MGRLALNRWGRINALAARVALVSGVTEKIILSGGKTRPKWAETILPPERLDNWPSEAELMKDIIVRCFGRIYKEKYGRSIEKAIIIEDESTNTLENIAYTINNNSELLNSKTRIGLLGTSFHARRIEVIANLFSLEKHPYSPSSSENVLLRRALERKKSIYEGILRYMVNALQNPEFRKRVLSEERWESGLLKPEYLRYWIGYIGLVENPIVLQNVINMLKNPEWVEHAKEAFKKVGLNFDEISPENLIELKENNPKKFEKIRRALQQLRNPQHRILPPA